MRKELYDYDLKYSPLEKHDFALVRVLAYFRAYIPNKIVKAFVPHPLVKIMLSQPFQ